MKIAKVLQTMCQSVAILGLVACVSGGAIAYKTETDLEEAFGPGWSFQKFKDGKFKVTNFPKATEKTEDNYFPKGFENTDSAVLSFFQKGSLQTFTQAGNLEKSWITKGFSAHYVVFQDGTQVIWHYPIDNGKFFKGQMAEKWNSCSLAFLQEEKSASDNQIAVYKEVINSFSNVQYLGDHSEACGSEDAGKISNIDQIRKETGTEPLSKKVFF